MAAYKGTASKEFEERVVHTKRVSKKTKGGNKPGFTALVVVGNKKGRIGSGLGKAPDIRSAIQKGITVAKKNMVDVNLKGTTIAHRVESKYGAARIMLKPAPEGSGIIAGGVVRDVVELAGVKDISTKMLGSKSKLSNVRCTIEALTKLKETTKKDVK